MPQGNCTQCGTAYETEPDLSISSMRRKLSGSRYLSVIALLAATLSIVGTWFAWPTKPKPPVVYDTTGPGIIRYYGTGMYIQNGSESHRADLIIFENAYGAIKMMQPLCQSQLGIHAHMRTEIIFRWAPYRQWHSGRGPENGEECYDIHDVKSLGPDAP